MLLKYVGNMQYHHWFGGWMPLPPIRDLEEVLYKFSLND